MLTYFADISPEPVITLVDVQSTSIHQTAPWCPLNVPKRSPFTENHTFGFWSLLDEKIKSPSRLYLICVRARSCPCKTIGFCVVENSEVKFTLAMNNYESFWKCSINLPSIDGFSPNNYNILAIFEIRFRGNRFQSQKNNTSVSFFVCLSKRMRYYTFYNIGVCKKTELFDITDNTTW